MITFGCDINTKKKQLVAAAGMATFIVCTTLLSQGVARWRRSQGTAGAYSTCAT